MGEIRVPNTLRMARDHLDPGSDRVQSGSDPGPQMGPDRGTPRMGEMLKQGVWTRPPDWSRSGVPQGSRSGSIGWIIHDS